MEGKVFFDGFDSWGALAFQVNPHPQRYPLSGLDVHHLRSAEGWLELGNPVEANQELDAISPEHRAHPDVLLLRWHIYARAKMWHVCIVLADALTTRTADDPRGWVALAETLYFMNRITDAYTVAYAKALEFPDSWRLLYGTARYACMLGRTTEAEQYLQLAIAVGDSKAVKRRARTDPDLAPLWRRRRSSKRVAS
ncbi:MAG: tetratricopeptide repeat protein [Verrucomicrobiota bacterium]